MIKQFVYNTPIETNNDGAKMTNLNLKTLAAGLDDTFEWWGNQDSITVCRWYGQKLLR